MTDWLFSSVLSSEWKSSSSLAVSLAVFLAVFLAVLVHDLFFELFHSLEIDRDDVMLNQHDLKHEQFDRSRIHSSACLFHSSHVQTAMILSTWNYQKSLLFAYDFDFQLLLIDLVYVRSLNFEHAIRDQWLSKHLISRIFSESEHHQLENN